MKKQFLYLMFMLSNDYVCRKTNKPRYNVKGWYMSEKFDGQRAQWDPVNQHLISRYGNIIHAPEWFMSYLYHIPYHLDGELFMGYGNWELTGLFRKKDSLREQLWLKVRFMVFDIADHRYNGFIYRYQQLQYLFAQYKHNGPLELVDHYVIKDRCHLQSYYQGVLDKGGEGLMLKHARRVYRGDRTDWQLKYKPVINGEALIVGYNKGNGKFSHCLGSFRVISVVNGKSDEKVKFNISGMKQASRLDYRSTHPIGTMIRYRCQEYGRQGIPRFPIYEGIYQPI